jgi:hypothetical protein
VKEVTVNAHIKVQGVQTGPKIYVLVDRSIPSKGVPARSCFWNRVKLPSPPELLSISDSKESVRIDPGAEQVRIDLADIVIVNWDAANGDYSCGSDDVYLYFLTRKDRRTAFLANGGILLCEFQSGKGVLHQGAYDAIFGEGEVTVFEAQLGQIRKPARDEAGRAQQQWNEARSHGAVVQKFHTNFWCIDHPLTKDLPNILRARFVADTDQIFNYSTKFTEFQAYKDRKSQLWRGWFVNWRKGWAPLLVALAPKEQSARALRTVGVFHRIYYRGLKRAKSQYKRLFTLPRAILLAKVEGNGLLLASTMWIAGSRCQPLINRIVKDDIVNEVRRSHFWIKWCRHLFDFLSLGLIAYGYYKLFGKYYPNNAQDAGIGKLLGQAGFVWLAIIAWRFWRHFFWNRPYGVSVLQFFQFARKSFWETI